MVDFLMKRSVAAVAGAFFLFVLLAAAGADAAAPAGPVHIGHTTSVVADVKGQLGDAPAKRIVQAEKIFFNEAVITATESAIIIQFRDGSTFELGPNGAMTLDELVFNPFESESVKVMTLIQGSFSYVSGYVAKDSIATLITPTGTIGIRGSTMSGLSYPGKPDFLHVSKGVATYRNDAGPRSIRAGQSIAVVDRTTPAIEPEKMPPAVAAQALSHIEQSLGSAVTAAAQTLTPEQRAEDAAANAVPIAQQKKDLSAATTKPVVVAAPPAETPDIPLLSEAAKVGVLDAGNTETTAQQQAFLEKAEKAIPDAAAKIDAITAADQAKNEANVAVGTTEVIAGSSENAESAEMIGALVQASINANPDGTSLIAETAVKSSANNEAVDILDVVAETTKGAIAGVVGTDANLSEIVELAAKATITGASKAGISAKDAAGKAMEGVISGVAKTGADLGEVIKSAANGIIGGAVITGDDPLAAAASATEGAIKGAAKEGLDQAAVAKSTMEGVAKGSEGAGLEIAGMIEAALGGVATAIEATGGDLAAVTETVMEAVDTIAADLNVDLSAITEAAAAAEVALITTAAPAPDTAPLNLTAPEETVEAEAPEPENPSQDNASPS